MILSRPVLVTGGTGSFGRTMVEHLLKTPGAEIRVFSRDEKKQDDMRREILSPRVSYHLGDVRDMESVRAVMRGVGYVFHAAALKQVPSCERWPMEAIKTNVLGADNVMRAAVEEGVDRCVVLSTDKAVYPVSAMGTTKAMMEKLMIARSAFAPRTVLCATRYGNVMDSRGSVIPLFVKQIRAQQPMTITDPEMTRFLMSLQESVDLVLYAFEHAQPGDILIQKSPSCRIVDLTTALRWLIRLCPVPVVLGVRPGEKLYESLVSAEEMARAEDLGNYYRIPVDHGSHVAMEASESYNSHNARRLGKNELMNLLRTIPCVKEALA